MNQTKPCRTYGRLKPRLAMLSNSNTGMFDTSPVRGCRAADLFDAAVDTKRKMSLMPINEDQTLELSKPAPNINSSTRRRSSLQNKMKRIGSATSLETVDSEEMYLSSCMTLPSGVSIFLNQLQSNMMISSSSPTFDTPQGDSASNLDCSTTENMRNADATHDINVEGYVETKVLGKPEDHNGASTADLNIAQSTMINASYAPSTISLGLPEDISEIYDCRTSKRKCSTSLSKTSLSKKKLSWKKPEIMLKEASPHVSSSFSGKKIYRLSSLPAFEVQSVASNALLQTTTDSIPVNTLTSLHTSKPTCSEAPGDLSKSNVPVPNNSTGCTKHFSFRRPIASSSLDEVIPQSWQASLANTSIVRNTSTPQKIMHNLAPHLDLSPVGQESLSELEPNRTWGILNSQEIAPASPSTTSKSGEQEAPSSRELCCIVSQTFVTKRMGRLDRYRAYGGPNDPSSMPRDILSEN